MIQKGEEVTTKGDRGRPEQRWVTNTIRGSAGNLIILWESKNGEGACMPCVWESWKRDAAKQKTS